MKSLLPDNTRRDVRAGLFAGIAAVVARGVTATVLPSFAASHWAIMLGIAIHLGIAVALGLALVAALRIARCPAGSWYETAGIVAILAGIWAMNFFVVLPRFNPAFVALLPYGVTLSSKLLYGLAAAMILRASRSRRFETLYSGTIAEGAS